GYGRWFKSCLLQSVNLVTFWFGELCVMLHARSSCLAVRIEPSCYHNSLFSQPRKSCTYNLNPRIQKRVLFIRKEVLLAWKRVLFNSEEVLFVWEEVLIDRKGVVANQTPLRLNRKEVWLNRTPLLSNRTPFLPDQTSLQTSNTLPVPIQVYLQKSAEYSEQHGKTIYSMSQPDMRSTFLYPRGLLLLCYTINPSLWI
uniref:hypothetical protein n=1 Tax=Candidatus Electronema sp. TaxID=2698783 RepID=UPI004056CAF7